MDEIKIFLDLTKSYPLWFLIAVGGGYLAVYILKQSMEKKMEALIGRIEEIKKTSLEIKKDIRTEERTDLVEYRVAVEKWEDYLLRLLFDFTFQDPSQAQVKTLYEKEQKLFLEVRVAVVKACIYLRDEEMEKQLRETVLKIRKLYFPIIYQALPQLIDLQSQLLLLDAKLKKFRKTGDPSSAPMEEDRQLSARVQAAMTVEMKKFSEALMAQYRPIAEQLDILKTALRDYIYRPIQHAELNKD